MFLASACPSRKARELHYYALTYFHSILVLAYRSWKRSISLTVDNLGTIRELTFRTSA